MTFTFTNSIVCVEHNCVENNGKFYFHSKNTTHILYKAINMHRNVIHKYRAIL